MNKEGHIVLVDSHEENRRFLCDCLKGLGHKNKVVGFGDAQGAGDYIKDNIKNIFLVLQSTEAPRIEIPETRNMVYMHEKFNTEEIPYMFLVNSSFYEDNKSLNAFVHCYYKTSEKTSISETLCEIVLFWKDHMFPPKVQF